MHQCSPESRFPGRTSLLLARRYEISHGYHNAKPENAQKQSDKLHSIWENRNSQQENIVIL
ncbi:MAG: hypothetical protein CMM01_10445 [Rhodopirellula sp.]|nr:hypothetical protein [Rhodopirellula sp.]OUX51419.1 MAG: hypothetical protein CBE43_04085 [Rhodopirellula sp. TMED283]